jgi:predicted  nucleic acid-binding Zn-ribbon protein
MATVDPKATLLALIGLQRLDNDVARIRRRIAEGPQLLARRAERLQQEETRVQQAHAGLLELRKQVGLLELEIKTREGEIGKIQAAQGQSRTNEEFRAYNEHANRLRKENRAVEDRILEIEEKVEAAKQELAELEKLRDEHRKERDADAAQWQKDEAEYKAGLEQLQVRRDEYAKSLPPGPLQVYERVLRGREGKAVVPVEGRTCGGCQMGIVPNDMARLRGMSELVICRSCERILYLPELSGAVR